VAMRKVGLVNGKRPLSPILKVLAEEWEVCGRGSRA
jgi:hypothetical protein